MLAILYLFCYKCMYVYMLMGRKAYCIVNKILKSFDRPTGCRDIHV